MLFLCPKGGLGGYQPLRPISYHFLGGMAYPVPLVPCYYTTIVKGCRGKRYFGTLGGGQEDSGGGGLGFMTAVLPPLYTTMPFFSWVGGLRA